MNYLPRFSAGLVLLLLLTIMSNIECHGQIPGLDVVRDENSIKIPFRMEQGFIVVDAKINGISLNLIFDTGAENIILFDREVTDLSQVEYGREILIGGSDLDSLIPANIVRGVGLEVTNCPIVKRDIIVMQRNEMHLHSKLGFELNGILGGNYFNNLVVKIDFRKQHIKLFHPNHFDEKLKRYEALDINIVQNKPYLNAKVVVAAIQPIHVNLLLDTGASLPFLLHANSDSSIVIPDKTMLGRIGYGLSGALMGFIGKTESLQFGEYTFTNIITSYQDIYYSQNPRKNLRRNGMLGNVLLQRFKQLIIDYPNEKLYLRASRKYNKEFDYDKSGLSIINVGKVLDQYMVTAVINGSPAERAGILPGDIILKINGRKAYTLSLGAITRILSRKNGTKVKLELQRGKYTQIEFDKTIILNDWFTPTSQFEN